MTVRINANADSNGDSREQRGCQDIASKRRPSRLLVAFCVQEHYYQDAAAIVSGCTDMFDSYSRRIADIITSVHEQSAAVSFSVDLESVLDTARAEITYHRQWTTDVLAVLPADSQSTAPLRAAFDKASTARVRLLHDVMMTYDRYLVAHTNAIRLNQAAVAAQEEEERHA